jgi:hypothetical protein
MENRSESQQAVAAQEEVVTTQPEAVTILDPPDGGPKDTDSDLMRVLGCLNEMDADDLRWFADQLESRMTGIREKEEQRRPRLSIDKAHGEFKRLVRWLQNRTDTEKLAAVAFLTCLNGDVEMSIRRRGLYDGEIGQELDRDWDETAAAMIDGESPDSELAVIAAYVFGLQAAR